MVTSDDRERESPEDGWRAPRTHSIPPGMRAQGQGGHTCKHTQHPSSARRYAHCPLRLGQACVPVAAPHTSALNADYDICETGLPGYCTVAISRDLPSRGLHASTALDAELRKYIPSSPRQLVR